MEGRYSYIGTPRGLVAVDPLDCSPVIHKDAPLPPKCTKTALAFKSVMADAIERFLGNNNDWSKKRIAMELGYTQADLSHWLSPQCESTMPGHLIKPLCQILGDSELQWHVQEKAS